MSTRCPYCGYDLFKTGTIGHRDEYGCIALCDNCHKFFPIEEKRMNWVFSRRDDGRVEWRCAHGCGHGNHVHGCDGCCTRSDYPGSG